ncbi:hypothetical protein BGZ95_006367 [Linnemannia exigua]|uniref:Uncharacterized protein n=1 Tax=Linnemannia exigua TaxID=604196 RepID=A0AAD4DGH1_9FUNG|nr:hypothetical protein BGZ95_006367 [Linnemannia exigua]
MRGGGSSPPAPATPAGPPSPTTPGNSNGGTVDPNQPPNSTATGPLPGLISQVLNPPPILGNMGGTPSSTATSPTNPKKHPSVPNNDSGVDGNGNPISPSQTSHSKGDNDSGTDGSALSPGLITLLVIIVLAILAAVLFSCYRVRQSRRRRHQSWDEDILKNHAGSVGYSESGGGYGMYVGGSGSNVSAGAGSGGKERPDLWRKNLDLFHRE